jgi:hypothetical protein
MQGAAALYVGALAVLGLLFHLYAASPSCRLNIFFIAWTLVLGIGYTLLSVRPRPRQAAGTLVLRTGYMLLSVRPRPPQAAGTLVLRTGYTLLSVRPRPRQAAGTLVLRTGYMLLSVRPRPRQAAEPQAVLLNALSKSVADSSRASAACPAVRPRYAGMPKSAPEKGQKHSSLAELMQT